MPWPAYTVAQIGTLSVSIKIDAGGGGFDYRRAGCPRPEACRLEFGHSEKQSQRDCNRSAQGWRDSAYPGSTGTKVFNPERVA